MRVRLDDRFASNYSLYFDRASISNTLEIDWVRFWNVMRRPLSFNCLNGAKMIYLPMEIQLKMRIKNDL